MIYFTSLSCWRCQSESLISQIVRETDLVEVLEVLDEIVAAFLAGGGGAAKGGAEGGAGRRRRRGAAGSGFASSSPASYSRTKEAARRSISTRGSQVFCDRGKPRHFTQYSRLPRRSRCPSRKSMTYSSGASSTASTVVRYRRRMVRGIELVMHKTALKIS